MRALQTSSTPLPTPVPASRRRLIHRMAGARRRRVGGGARSGGLPGPAPPGDPNRVAVFPLAPSPGNRDTLRATDITGALVSALNSSGVINAVELPLGTGDDAATSCTRGRRRPVDYREPVRGRLVAGDFPGAALEPHRGATPSCCAAGRVRTVGNCLCGCRSSPPEPHAAGRRGRPGLAAAAPGSLPGGAGPLLPGGRKLPARLLRRGPGAVPRRARGGLHLRLRSAERSAGGQLGRGHPWRRSPSPAIGSGTRLLALQVCRIRAGPRSLPGRPGRHRGGAFPGGAGVGPLQPRRLDGARRGVRAPVAPGGLARHAGGECLPDGPHARPRFCAGVTPLDRGGAPARRFDGGNPARYVRGDAPGRTRAALPPAGGGVCARRWQCTLEHQHRRRSRCDLRGGADPRLRWPAPARVRGSRVARRRLRHTWEAPADSRAS